VSEWKIRFGTAGTSDSFTAMGYKNSLDIPAYTEKMGLDAFEYQCGHGVWLGLDKARQMADDAAARGILFSVHAPYYISASSLDEEKRLNSVNYLLQSAALCRALGGRRVIFHSGNCGRQSREAALEKALDTLKRAQDALDEAGFAEITLCPETMGKIGQLGTLEEVLALCGVDRRITPCIDFGHLNARTLGGIRSKADYAAILDRIGEALGDARARQFHVHFSRIEYSKGGEKRHWTFAETQFGPEPQPLMELLAERGLAPVIICESAGTQAEDAQTMQRMYCG
jgi:endonuclease IV